MTSSQKHSKSGCFSGVLRRFFCSDGPKTHPSDLITDFQTTTEFIKEDIFKVQPKIQAPATPGIVARLMGLDSLPESSRLYHVKSPDSFIRSRSVNFMDYLLEFDLTQAKHRRVRTSVSFREVPAAFLGERMPEALVHQFDNGSESWKMERKEKKEERKLRKESNEKIKELGSVHRRKLCSNIKAKRSLKNLNQKEAVDELELTKKKKKRTQRVKRVKKSCNSSNSTLSENTRKVKLIKKTNDPEKKTEHKRDGGGLLPESVIELANKLCRLTEQDVREEKWIRKIDGFKSEVFEEMCVDIGGQILDHLLQQFVEECAVENFCKCGN